jgi:hypothetical protein
MEAKVPSAGKENEMTQRQIIEYQARTPWCLICSRKAGHMRMGFWLCDRHAARHDERSRRRKER